MTKRKNKNQFKNVDAYGVHFLRNKKSHFDVDNQAEYFQQYNMLKMLAISVFKWEGLPPSIDEMYLERTLFEQGKVLFFDDKHMAKNGEQGTTPLALAFAPQGDLDIYGYTKTRMAYAKNGYTVTRHKSNSIIAFDNMMKLSLEETVSIYARRLADVERVIDVNLANTKNPYIVVTDERNKEMIEGIIKDIYSNKPLIMLNDDMAEHMKTKNEVLNLDSPFVADKLMDYKNTLRNEIFTILGVGNSSQDKRERLTSGEMRNVDMLNEAFATTRLRAREQAVERLKEMYPDIYKDLRVSFATEVEDKSVEVFDNGSQNDNDK